MANTMNPMTKLEELAIRFIDSTLKERPIPIDSLEGELNEYVGNIPELKSNPSRSNILYEYNKSDKKKIIDEEINDELINAAERVHLKEGFSKGLSDKEIENVIEDLPDTSLLLYMELPDELLIYDLMNLAVRNDRVRIRDMYELEEAEQEDPYSPNTWIYHKDWELTKVLDYVRREYDEYRKEDELEEKLQEE